jgi:DNA-binding XRE family transcriptional regulator
MPAISRSLYRAARTLEALASGHEERIARSTVDPALARVLRRIREERGVSQNLISSEVGITMSTWAKLEREKTTPTWTTFRTIARGLGLTVTELAQLVEAEGG